MNIPLVPPVTRVALVGLASLALASCARQTVTASMTRGYDSQVQAGFERARAATAPFKMLDSAIAAGYPATVAQCIAHTEHGTMGAMGFHHVKRAIVDTVLEVDKPEILLYEKRPDGTYRLNGVEYIVPYRAWPRDTVGPTIMGQRMKREDNLKFWYLHAWAWSENADGMFSDFNPSVRCGADARVFKPYEAPPPVPVSP
jgi:hypothetical protein